MNQAVVHRRQSGAIKTKCLELAGGRNVFADQAALWPSVSLEELVRRNPDWHNCKASSGIIGAHSSTALLRLLSRVNDGRLPCRLADFLEARDYEGQEQ